MTIKAIKDLTLSDTIDGVVGFGEITYNGWTFNAIRRVEMSSRVVYDDAGRTAKFVEYTMSVSGFINGADVDACQTNMNEIHRKMNEAGQTLVIDGIGFDSTINTARNGATPDVAWGASPQSFKFRPLGGNIAWAFQWEIKFNLHRCESATTLVNRFLAFNYSVAYSTNTEGLVERVIEGHVEIPQNRNPAAARVIDWDLELAYDRVNFQLPVCFRRVSSQRKLLANRSRLEFTIVDQELVDLPYPAGIVEADADYDFENIGRTFEGWVATLTCDFRVARGYPRTLAAQKFFLILAEKTAKLRAAASADGGAAIPMKLRIGAQMFGRSSRFQAIIQVFACLKEILKSSGLWTPIAGTSYQQWRQSMDAVGAFNKRGRGNWRHTPSQDAIIDICTPAELPAMGNDLGTCDDPHAEYLNPDLCPPGDPYLHYENEIHAEQNQNVVVHRLSQFFDNETTVPSSVGLAMFFPTLTASSALADHVSQYESAPDNYVVMIGRAIRLNKAPDIPKLLKIGDVEVEEVARRVAPKAIASYFGCTAIGARWAILYRVKGQIKTIKPPPNEERLCFKGE